MQEYLDRRVAMGTAFLQTYFLMLIADSRLHLGEIGAAMKAAREGLARADRTNERLSVAELYRIIAACHLRDDRRNSAAAEEALRAALADACGRGARMWELSAAKDLASLWCNQIRPKEARDLFAPLYGWFTEGIDMPDLKEARVLLDGLRE